MNEEGRESNPVKSAPTPPSIDRTVNSPPPWVRPGLVPVDPSSRPRDSSPQFPFGLDSGYLLRITWVSPSGSWKAIVEGAANVPVQRVFVGSIIKDPLLI